VFVATFDPVVDINFVFLLSDIEERYRLLGTDSEPHPRWAVKYFASLYGLDEEIMRLGVIGVLKN
jgi:hypothetical protein